MPNKPCHWWQSYLWWSGLWFGCLWLGCLLIPSVVFAQTAHTPLPVNSDPQYLVMNFSTLNELNWAAPENEWQSQIKPQVLQQLDELLTAVSPNSSHSSDTNSKSARNNYPRQLAWSTLNEYMNYPLDEPGQNSPYVIKVKRIFEVAAEKNLPVFIPLNGFQWWDNLPELYNWWDADGSRTSASFFERQKNPEEFKKRFIAGYQPDNKWNVEWQSWQTPMQLNWRNWGGGEFRLAPPPNLLHHEKAELSYRSVLDARLTAITQQIRHSVAELNQQGRNDLFVGMSLGTEISLNASTTPQDEFAPYGFRSIQDWLCPDRAVSCLAEELHSASNSAQLQTWRSQVVHQHLLELSWLVSRLGIPKQKLYTHVWGEVSTSDPRYAPYAQTAFNLYSRPGISLYGFASDPYSSPSWQIAQAQTGYSPWGAVEYSVPKDSTAVSALEKTLNADDPARTPATLIVMYNWSEHRETDAILALKTILSQPLKKSNCQLPELIPQAKIVEDNPTQLKWQFAFGEPTQQTTLWLQIVKGLVADIDKPIIHSTSLSPTQTTLDMPKLSPGVYTWYLHSTGCNDQQQRFSQPVTIVISHVSQPWWRKI